MRKAINLAVIDDNKLLLVRKRKTWILPGGKPEGNESDKECLIREIGEELSGTIFVVCDYYKSFKGETPYKKDMLEAVVYFGIIECLGIPFSEISEVRYINDFENYNLSDITRKIVDSLKLDRYLT